MVDVISPVTELASAMAVTHQDVLDAVERLRRARKPFTLVIHPASFATQINHAGPWSCRRGVWAQW